MLDELIRSALDTMLAHPQHRLPWPHRRAIYDALRSEASGFNDLPQKNPVKPGGDSLRDTRDLSMEYLLREREHRICGLLGLLAARKVLPIFLEKMAIAADPDLDLQDLVIRSLNVTEAILKHDKEAIDIGYDLLD